MVYSKTKREMVLFIAIVVVCLVSVMGCATLAGVGVGYIVENTADSRLETVDRLYDEENFSSIRNIYIDRDKKPVCETVYNKLQSAISISIASWAFPVAVTFSGGVTAAFSPLSVNNNNLQTGLTVAGGVAAAIGGILAVVLPNILELNLPNKEAVIECVR